MCVIWIPHKSRAYTCNMQINYLISLSDFHFACCCLPVKNSWRFPIQSFKMNYGCHCEWSIQTADWSIIARNNFKGQFDCLILWPWFIDCEMVSAMLMHHSTNAHKFYPLLRLYIHFKKLDSRLKIMSKEMLNYPANQQPSHLNLFPNNHNLFVCL